MCWFLQGEARVFALKRVIIGIASVDDGPKTPLPALTCPFCTSETVEGAWFYFG
jgi:hypothetical protein